MQTTLALNAQQTMSSRVIAEITGKDHAHVLRDIRKILVELYPNGNPESDGIDGKAVFHSGIKISRRADNGQIAEMLLPKRDALILTSGYSIKQRANIIDRWQELEAKQQFNIPTTLSGALRLASEQAETIETQTLLIEQQKPAVAFVERYVESNGNKGFRDVCKLLKANEARFKEFLIAEKIFYRLDGRLMAYGNHIDAGRFEVNAGIADNEHAFTVAKFTPKGINWVAGLWAVYNLSKGD